MGTESLTYTTNSVNQYIAITGTGELSYDEDGNLIEKSDTRYSWNAENRLVTVAPQSPAPGDTRAEFVYDYMGRRVRTSVYTYSGTWQESETRLFVYDANGNVGQMVDAEDGTMAAAYEYDPYGNLLRADGEYASENPFRFSTKY